MTKSIIPFTKMHGAGNDYIYVNTLTHPIADPAAMAVRWSRPHFGIGSDGLVLIGAPSDKQLADFSMRIFNADGSEAMMCGNASRCIGKYLYEKGLTHQTEIRLETLSGIKKLVLQVEGGHVKSVTVDMLEPLFSNPEQYDESRHVNLPKGLHTTHATYVCMGNPHYVLFLEDLKNIDIAAYGSQLEHDSAFPQRCNIEFAQILGDDRIRARVWERGSGITMACGTGACATAVAAAKLELTSRHSSIIMDGGTLDVTWNPEDNHVYLSGPAEFVFEGEIEI